MRTRTRLLFGFCLIIVGGIFMAIQVFGLDFDLGDMIATLWPVALILVGVYLIWRQRNRAQLGPDEHVVDKTFGDIKISGPDLDPDGINAELGCGDIRIDLTRAEFGNKEHRMRAHVGIGEVKIVLPKDISVNIKASSGIGDAKVLGRRDSGFGADVVYISDGYDMAAKKLRINAESGIGEVEIYRE